MKKLLLITLLITSANVWAFGEMTIQNSDGSQSWVTQDSMGNTTVRNSNGSSSLMTPDSMGNTTVHNSDGSTSYIHSN